MCVLHIVRRLQHLTPDPDQLGTAVYTVHSTAGLDTGQGHRIHQSFYQPLFLNYILIYV